MERHTVISRGDYVGLSFWQNTLGEDLQFRNKTFYSTIAGMRGIYTSLCEVEDSANENEEDFKRNVRWK